MKATIIADETSVLDDAQAARAEALVLDQLVGGQAGRLIAAAVVAVEPAGAEKRRERAEREQARVAFWRERAASLKCLMPDRLSANIN